MDYLKLWDYAQFSDLTLLTWFSVNLLPHMGIFTDEDDASKTPRNDNMLNNLKGYLDTRLDLVRLEVQEKVKAAFVSTMHGVAMAAIGLFFFLFLNLFIGLLLNETLDSSYWGFGILAGFYLVLLIIFLVGIDKKIFQGVADKTLDNTIYKSDKRQA